MYIYIYIINNYISYALVYILQAGAESATRLAKLQVQASKRICKGLSSMAW